MRRNCGGGARGRCGAASCPGKFDGACRADLRPGDGGDAGDGSAVRLGGVADRPRAIRRPGRICADAVAGAQPAPVPVGNGATARLRITNLADAKHPGHSLRARHPGGVLRGRSRSALKSNNRGDLDGPPLRPHVFGRPSEGAGHDDAAMEVPFRHCQTGRSGLASRRRKARLGRRVARREARAWWNGRHWRLKIARAFAHAGSTPAARTKPRPAHPSHRHRPAREGADPRHCGHGGTGGKRF